MSRAQQKIETRQRLLEAAIRVGLAQGFIAARTADVAKHAGVSHGALFVHFPSREALLLEAIEEVGRRITERLHQVVRGRGSLRDVLRAHLACLAENEEVYRRLLVEGPMLPAGAREVWIGVQSAISHHISEVAEQEMTKGRIRALPLHLLFNIWLGLLHHYLTNADLFAPGKSVLAVHGGTLLDEYLGLLAVTKERARWRRSASPAACPCEKKTTTRAATRRRSTAGTAPGRMGR